MILRDKLDAIREALEATRSNGDSGCQGKIDDALDALRALEQSLADLKLSLKTPAINSAQERGRGERVILVAEDESPARRVMIHLLDQAGYVVLEAENGAAALRLALYHEGRIDLLLTDLVMPDFDGIALAEQIRRVRPEMKILFMSGFAPDELRRQSVELDRVDIDVMRKPFRREELLTTLKSLLG
ncbi:MAG: response regulator [Kiritimatiellia bacterium]